MRNKYWFVLLTFILGFVACTEDRLGDQADLQDGLNLLLSVPQSTVVSPMTKAGQEDTKIVSDLNILIYNSGETNVLPIKSYYYTTSEEMKGLSASNTSANPVTFNFPLSNGSYSVRVVANAGSEMSGMTCGEVDTKTFGYKNDGSIYMAMYGSDDVTVANGRGGASISLERIYAMITVQVQKNLATDIDITPTQVELIHVPATGCLTGTNAIGTNCLLKDGTGGFLKSDLAADHATAVPFYMYENMQPLGYCLKDGKEFTGEWKSTYNGNQAYKTPASMGGATKDPAVVGRNKTCSYIEVVADYTGSKGNGTVNYRFFLGKDAYTSFAVERNTHYQVTLTLSGDGGVDEASWRVTTAIMGAFTPHDAYVGYLVGSKSRVYVDLGNDTNLPNSNWTIRKKSGTDVVTTSSNLQRDGDRYYFEVVAKETNVSDRSTQSGVYTISSNKASESKDVTVTQVIRILDPIAYYHQNPQTVFEKDVVVKVFNRNPDNFYIPLSSVGAWTVSVESGNWFTLSKHQDYTGDNTVSADNNVITGEGGAVKFHFKASTLGNNSARYGCISVKYHNNMCEHKIYLRQGGGDTELISGQAQWAYSNVIKRGTNGTYATQPGPMFAGGNSSTLYNSYTPGYNISYDISGQDRSNWMTISGDHYSEPLQGPCPKGYTLPSIRDMSVLKKACHMDNLTAAVGYIYDDDPTPGWEWSQRNGVYYANPNNMDHSNPAKGIVLVNTNNYVNLVFPFGNGVLKHAGVPDNGMDTGLDEIGVGFRTSGKLYTEEDVMENGSINVYVSYNANYWSGSLGSGGNQHLSYMKFWYFLKRNVPIYLSDGSNRWGESWEVSWNGAGGLDRKNGMFVRCVKNSKPADRNYYSNNF